ncbi:MAG TPA: hypothetical protein VMB72_11655 [Acidimicrobiales bacterium]|nr:hypothetical protein [Acidimicrobiales bacterium]
MLTFSLLAAVQRCQTGNTAGVVGASLLLAIFVGLIVYAIYARRQLLITRTELGFLRPEIDRLRDWQDSIMYSVGGGNEADDGPHDGE